MTYEQATAIVLNAQKGHTDLSKIPEGVWQEILEAFLEPLSAGVKTEHSMPDPDFSLEEMDQAETVIKSLGPR